MPGLGAMRGRRSPLSLLRQSETDLRQSGLSAAKIKTIRGLADAAVSGAINFESLHELKTRPFLASWLASGHRALDGRHVHDAATAPARHLAGR
jgi:hypothetical protein